MISFWNWLEGKKTAIGAFLLIVYGIPHLNTVISSEWIDVIYYLGAGLSGTGIFHKVVKSRRNLQN